MDSKAPAGCSDTHLLLSASWTDAGGSQVLGQSGLPSKFQDSGLYGEILSHE